MSIFVTSDLAGQQLDEYAKNHPEKKAATTTSGEGVPYLNASLTVGKRGPQLLQDWYYIDEMAHFDRERIPERVVHAKGAGAFGHFEVTHDITRYTAAKVFSEIGKKTDIAVRFSEVAGERGYPDAARDVRGFAIKFYTEDGIWDLVGNNTPTFFIRDAILFPSFIHALKRNPVTNLRDANAFWDFVSGRPETTHQLLMLFSDRGVPDGYRHMHGYGSNTFSLVNKDGAFHYCKFHYLTNQGIKNLSTEQANTINGIDPDYFTRDLYNHIHAGNYPSWDFYIQVMTPEEAKRYPYDPFDVTKVWLHADYPLIPVGRFTLDRNQSNYFAEIEQLSFEVSHLVPGINVSPDRMLQGRLFSYGDTARYRLGANGTQLPVNRPFKFDTYTRDGRGTYDGQNGAPNYHPNTYNGPVSDRRSLLLSVEFDVAGKAGKYDNGDDDNYSQAGILYKRVMDGKQKEVLASNIAQNLQYADQKLIDRAIGNFTQVDEDLGYQIKVRLAPKQYLHADV